MRVTDIIGTARGLRAAQKAYLTIRKIYPEGHAVREQAGKLVETMSQQLDLALDLYDASRNRPGVY